MTRTFRQFIGVDQVKSYNSRKEVPEKYKWDLSNFVKDEKDYQAKINFVKENLKKLKEWYSYVNELKPSPSDKEYSILNARLRAACGKDLRDFDKKRLEKIKKVEDRGYIKTNSEFYLMYIFLSVILFLL